MTLDFQRRDSEMVPVIPGLTLALDVRTIGEHAKRAALHSGIQSCALDCPKHGPRGTPARPCECGPYPSTRWDEYPANPLLAAVQASRDELRQTFGAQRAAVRQEAAQAYQAVLLAGAGDSKPTSSEVVRQAVQAREYVLELHDADFRAISAGLAAALLGAGPQVQALASWDASKAPEGAQRHDGLSRAGHAAPSASKARKAKTAIRAGMAADSSESAAEALGRQEDTRAVTLAAAIGRWRDLKSAIEGLDGRQRKLAVFAAADQRSTARRLAHDLGLKWTEAVTRF